jgi:hypothetical protein
MHLLVALALLAGCRMNFDPVDEQRGAGDGDESETSMETASQVMTAQPDSDFFTTCMSSQPCLVDCSQAATCIVDCNAASTCDVVCAEASCLVQACVAPACEVDCGSSRVIALGAIATCE